MKKIDVVILAAGKGARMGLGINKTLYQIFDRPLFSYSLTTFYNHDLVNDIYIVVDKESIDLVNEYLEVNGFLGVSTLVGGNTRSKSVKNALTHIKNNGVLIHDAARPLVNDNDITAIIKISENYLCATLYHDVVDTIKDCGENIKTLTRANLKAVSTPQYFDASLFDLILKNNNEEITDELQLFEGQTSIGFVQETSINLKITTPQDLEYLRFLLSKGKQYRIGHSLDYHRLENNRKLILGGVLIPYEKGLTGHSDADCVYHVVTEAILGALGYGDIGTLFPDTDESYKNQNSKLFVERAVEMMLSDGYLLENIDLIIYIEKPNLKDYKNLMAKNIKELTKAKQVNVKATTMEKHGVIGTGLGIASEAVVLLRNNQ